MQSNIQIQDLEANYLADLENPSVAGVYGGGFFEGLGDAVEAVYDAGKDLARSIAKAVGY